MSARRLLDRPTVGSLTVPFMVDAARRPIDFKQLDAAHVERCAKHHRCGVCGRRIAYGKPIAFIGPADGRTCFADPWMHPECAAMAVAQCPFLRGTRDWRDATAVDDPLLAGYRPGALVTYLAADSRAHRDRSGAWHFERVVQ